MYLVSKLVAKSATFASQVRARRLLPDQTFLPFCDPHLVNSASVSTVFLHLFTTGKDGSTRYMTQAPNLTSNQPDSGGPQTVVSETLRAVRKADPRAADPL